MTRYVVGLAVPWPDQDIPLHCEACYLTVYLTSVDIGVLWDDRGRVILCTGCLERLLLQGTLA
jgi:hypothetical protein